MTNGLPFDDIRNLIAGLPAMDQAAASRVQADLAADGHELGQVRDVAQWFAAATGRAPARVSRPMVALFAATHAVSGKRGMADPIGEAQIRVEAIAAGAAPVSQLCADNNLGLNVFDLALELPVADFSAGPALEERAAAATMAFGMEAIAAGPDLICLGTVDAAGELSASALLCAVLNQDISEWAEFGADDLSLVNQALELHQDHLRDPLEALRRLGGRETAALAGAIIAARAQKIAVILDGPIATAAAAVLYAMNQNALEHCLLAAAQTDAHRKAAALIGLKPVLNLEGLSSGGVAGALAAGVVRGASEISARRAEVNARLRA